ncbi:MAG: 2Fe-2S iron-sulfur cluster-binding protein [Nitrosomonas sp.]|uniref:2Fe-2S iron-sulfur cluster-binding protein n=1 Tax=Nitrosomonas sp. TaxID=42353 RepID=UPI002732B55E|nr:2Fe-2S iron-sulfur cluster-binding protein [Nitrosomonas sp.]MDP3280199.1 2Fe-2S iron-sulfur cluster-binding protein [Nitrosomonas sp.]MDP3662821.1 2Fe-2S iron-sulfur cluster-binding protein [Nitrosomonas sp.]MDZ4107962.1 2Fe-2S iron-sulfur cluster-binding protein [Nitrosomonas sp.]
MSANPNTITIDGQEIPFTAKQTIMDAALAAGVYIPHLCHYPGLPPSGNCRLCMVETGNRNVAACITPAVAGQEIRNNTPELNEVRKSITQMLFVEGNHICPSCEKTGNCKLQAMGYYLGMLEDHFPQFYQRREMDASHAEILLDRGRCILCDLCVRASRDVDGKNVFAIAGRGTNAHLIINSPTGKLADSTIATTDLAATICPVGAILIKEQGYQVPVGQRIYDQHTIREIGLQESIAKKNDD